MVSLREPSRMFQIKLDKLNTLIEISLEGLVQLDEMKQFVAELPALGHHDDRPRGQDLRRHAALPARVA